jgi:hypothetical protein
MDGITDIITAAITIDIPITAATIGTGGGSSSLGTLDIIGIGND